MYIVYMANENELEVWKKYITLSSDMLSVKQRLSSYLGYPKEDLTVEQMLDRLEELGMVRNHSRG